MQHLVSTIKCVGSDETNHYSNSSVSTFNHIGNYVPAHSKFENSAFIPQCIYWFRIEVGTCFQPTFLKKSSEADVITSQSVCLSVCPPPPITFEPIGRFL
jgi:hypothetical protein